jgi:hypothetical protein
MKTRWLRSVRFMIISIFAMIAAVLFGGEVDMANNAIAQTVPAATPLPATAFDQAAALSKLREQIKGKEKEPASAVFKNIQMMKAVPAGRLLAVMEMGYARSLGVNCTHCHVPDKWESEEKSQKQVARDMSAMVTRVNGELLKGIKNLKSEAPTINCTTCHRGEIKPALNLAARS